MVDISVYSPNKNVKIYAKLERGNPGGSVKDRPALFMIRAAEKAGILKKGSKIIEATSGNTGIGLAMISAVLGYKFTAVMSESVSVERRQLLGAFGADVVLTDGAGGTNLAIEKAKEMLKEDSSYIMLDQFRNEANVMSHYKTTAVEILKDAPDITHFVAGMGTGGTLMGVQKRLKEHDANIQIVGIEPENVTKLQGLRNMEAYSPEIYDENKLDKKIMATDEDEAIELAHRLFREQGISVGISSGAALWGARKVAEELDEGAIVALFPDGGEKYLSSVMFDSA